MEIELSTRPRAEGLTALGEVDLTPGEIDLEIEELESRIAFITVDGGGCGWTCGACSSASCRGCICP